MAALELQLVRKRVYEQATQLQTSIHIIRDTFLQQHPEKKMNEPLKEFFLQLDNVVDTFKSEMELIQKNHFDDIPSDLLRVLFLMLPISDVLRLTQVCKRFRNQTRSEDFWKELVLKWWFSNAFDKKYKIQSSNLIEIITIGQKWGWTWLLFARCIGRSDSQQGYSWHLGEGMAPLLIGEMKTGKLHGRGLLFTQEGNNYIGQLVEGELSGGGMFTWYDGDRYIGEYRHGTREGKGTYSYAGGSKHEGLYRAGKANGYGIYTHPDGSKYEGEYKDDKRHGKGVYIWSNGTRFEGEFRADVIHGRGTVYFTNGSTFETDFEDDAPKDKNARFHPEIKLAIENKKCSTMVTGTSQNYWQFLFKCKTCANRKWYCITCRQYCHPPNHEWKRGWVCGTGYCECFKDGKCFSYHEHPDKSQLGSS